jgi:hypothetical protein
LFTFKRINAASGDLSNVQDNVADVFRTLALNPLLDGTLVSAQRLAIGANVINHTLGRTPLGWVVTDRNAATTIYRTAWDNRTLTLNSSAVATVTLWIF